MKFSTESPVMLMISKTKAGVSLTNRDNIKLLNISDGTIPENNGEKKQRRVPQPMAESEKPQPLAEAQKPQPSVEPEPSAPDEVVTPSIEPAEPAPPVNLKEDKATQANEGEIPTPQKDPEPVATEEEIKPEDKWNKLNEKEKIHLDKYNEFYSGQTAEYISAVVIVDGELYKSPKFNPEDVLEIKLLDFGDIDGIKCSVKAKDLASSYDDHESQILIGDSYVIIDTVLINGKTRRESGDINTVTQLEDKKPEEKQQDIGPSEQELTEIEKNPEKLLETKAPKEDDDTEETATEQIVQPPVAQPSPPIKQEPNPAKQKRQSKNDWKLLDDKDIDLLGKKAIYSSGTAESVNIILNIDDKLYMSPKLGPDKSIKIKLVDDKELYFSAKAKDLAEKYENYKAFAPGPGGEYASIYNILINGKIKPSQGNMLLIRSVAAPKSELAKETPATAPTPVSAPVETVKEPEKQLISHVITTGTDNQIETELKPNKTYIAIVDGNEQEITSDMIEPGMILKLTPDIKVSKNESKFLNGTFTVGGIKPVYLVGYRVVVSSNGDKKFVDIEINDKLSVITNGKTESVNVTELTAKSKILLQNVKMQNDDGNEEIGKTGQTGMYITSSLIVEENGETGYRSMMSGSTGKAAGVLQTSINIIKTAGSRDEAIKKLLTYSKILDDNGMETDSLKVIAAVEGLLNI